MDPSSQPILIDIPEQPPRDQRAEPRGIPKLRTVNRQQTTWRQIDTEELIPADHKARAIWNLTGRLDLSRFIEQLRTAQGCAGRSAWDPRVLVSLWVYAYSESIGSAREIERVMQWEPGMQWLAGLEVVNHHTLSDFRVDHKKALDDLFAQLLALLATEGLVNLERVMHDGTKIRAQAGAGSFRREKTLREHLEEARQTVEQMGDPAAPAPAKDRQRAARERAARLEAAQQELTALQAEAKTAQEKAEVRVSLTEPEARKMKHGDNAIAPSYNAQISTEAENKIIVGAHLSQCSNDSKSLMPALEEVERNLGKKPAQVVVDGGYTSRDNIIKCAAQGIDMVGSLRDPQERSAAAMKAMGIGAAFGPAQFRILDNGERLECPAGCSLKKSRKNRKRGNQYQQYRARGEDCGVCPHRPQCCPKSGQKGRTVAIKICEQEDVAAFRKKMETEESRAVYRKRGEVAEFPNAWIKEKLGLRKFHVRGLVKAGSELLWACLTYNIMQWERLKWRPATAA
jgi:transposase